MISTIENASGRDMEVHIKTMDADTGKLTFDAVSQKLLIYRLMCRNFRKQDYLHRWITTVTPTRVKKKHILWHCPAF